MINLHTTVVSALNEVLPTYYEMILTPKTETPCISYMELTNVDSSVGDTIGYSNITYQVKVWSKEIREIQDYSLQIDGVMRGLGFKRIGSAELHDNQSAMIQKILTYKCLALEEF